MPQHPDVEAADLAQPMTPGDYDAIDFVLGPDGLWRAYDENGLIAWAPSFRQIYERTGGRWN